ncbi:YciI family protein [Acidipropionibacterium thoenii]|uniref:YciI family protein n=1 Tax=Acidipropionibacterium thoenii TaxID=1751 RepID=UPI0003FA28CB|nr:YciI family protein [Acidipropionibacterium thoenii]
MTTYLISFPSQAMQVPAADLPGVADAAHHVVGQAKAAGVWVFGGGIDESIAPVRVDAEARITEGTYPQTRRIEGGYCILELPSYDQAIEWAARFAAACRCAQEVRAFQYDPES